MKLRLSATIKDEITLYHSTFLALLPSIKKYGLGGKVEKGGGTVLSREWYVLQQTQKNL
jgi:hypothetical protein